jgi:serine/threonine protein kinase
MTSHEIAEQTTFWKDTLEFRLLTPEQIERCFSLIPDDKRQADKLENRLARLAIRLGYVTLWQAQRVLTKRCSTLFIDKYLLIDSLGQGGMGRVYLAKDRRLNRHVALKVLNPDKLNHERALARFEREALVGGQLQHENLVRVYDVGMHQDSPFLVMEYIEGPTVAELIAKLGRLDLAVAARIGRDVARGLHHLAEKRLVHRDVNPRNILIDQEGRAKLTDLGLAIFEEQLSQVTTEGSTVGTFDYIAPEQARHSRGVDIRSDIYSLGCSLYHMLSGRPPFPDGNLAEKIYSHQLREARPLSEAAPSVSPEISEIVHKCLRKKPEDRFESARDLADQLNRLVTEESLSTTIELTRFASDATRIPETADRKPMHDESPSGRPEAENHVVGQPRTTGPGEVDVISQSLQLDLGIDSLETAVRNDGSRVRSISLTTHEAVLGHRKTLFLAVLVVVSVIAALVQVTDFNGPGTTPDDRLSSSGGNPARQTPVPVTPANIPPQPPAENEPPGIFVSYDDRQTKRFDSIDEALRSAMGQSALIEIEAQEPPWVWKVAENRPIANCRWIIRNRGMSRVHVILDVSEATSGLVVRADSKLEMSGLRIEPKNAKAGSPLMSIFGECSIHDTWWFCREGDTAPKSAMRIGTRRLTISNSWIHGFPVAIDAQVLPETTIGLTNCMISTSRTDGKGKSQGSERKAPALVSLDLPSWNVDRASLKLDRCTLIGPNAIQVSGTNVSPKMTILAMHSLFKANDLFTLAPSRPPGSFTFRWTGESNLFDLSGAYWPSHDSTPRCMTLEAWESVVSEKNSAQRHVPLSNPTSTVPKPSDFLPRLNADREFGSASHSSSD